MTEGRGPDSADDAVMTVMHTDRDGSPPVPPPRPTTGWGVAVSTDAGSWGLPAEVAVGTLVDTLGPSLLTVVVAPHGLAVPVLEVAIHDAATAAAAGFAQVVTPGDLVLAVGVDVARPEAAFVLDQLGAAGAAAVVVKAAGEVPAALTRTAEDHGLVLLVAPPAVAWGQLHRLLLSARTAAGDPGAGQQQGVGDLFALANAVAAMVGGAVTIEDVHSSVLAYSTSGEPIDPPRRETILGRHVPAPWMQRLTDAGVFRQLWAGRGVVRLRMTQDDKDGMQAMDRCAVAIRAGEEVLGSIWVVEGPQGLGERAERALVEAARIAALHLLRHRRAEDLERHRAAEQVRGVLERRLPPAVLGPLLGVTRDDPVAVLALEPVGTPDGPPVQLERAADLLLLTAQAYRRVLVPVALGGAVHVVVAGAAAKPEDLRRVVEETLPQIRRALRDEVRVGIGSTVTGLAFATSQDEAEQALAIARDRGVVGVLHVDDVRAHAVLRTLRRLVADDPRLAGGRVQLLAEHDRRHQSEYVATLRAYLDAFGDVRAAVALVHVHPNTFRYRIRRISELTGIDLDDPVERLVTHLQLHLLDSAGTA